MNKDTGSHRDPSQEILLRLKRFTQQKPDVAVGTSFGIALVAGALSQRPLGRRILSAVGSGLLSYLLKMESK